MPYFAGLVLTKCEPNRRHAASRYPFRPLRVQRLRLRRQRRRLRTDHHSSVELSLVHSVLGSGSAVPTFNGKGALFRERLAANSVVGCAYTVLRCLRAFNNSSSGVCPVVWIQFFLGDEMFGVCSFCPLLLGGMRLKKTVRGCCSTADGRGLR